MSEIIHHVNSSLFQVGIQAENNTGAVGTAVDPLLTLTYVQDPVTLTINENATSKWFINSGTERDRTHIAKGVHEAGLRFRFWVEKELSQSSSIAGFWLLKMPLDDSSTTSTATYTIPATTNEYGTQVLTPMTVDFGYNTTSNIIRHRITGAVVNSMTFVAEEGKECLWTFDCMGVHANTLSSAFVSLGEVTTKPFTWGDVSVAYGNAGASSAIPDIMRVEFTVNNKVRRVFNLNNATSIRYCNYFVCGKREITGVIRFRLSTNAAQGIQLFEDYYGADSATAPAATTVLKDIVVTLYEAASKDIAYTLHDVTIGEPLVHNISGSDEQMIDVPFSATHIVLVIRATDASPPTNFA